MDNNLLENPLVLRMFQSIYTETLKEKVIKDSCFLNICTVDEFVRVSEIIKEDTEYSFDILKDLLSVLLDREDLQPVFNMVLCNVCYYLDKFDNVDYVMSEVMSKLFLPFLKSKEVKYINRNLLKYFLELVQRNLKQFKSDSKNELINLLL